MRDDIWDGAFEATWFGQRQAKPRSRITRRRALPKAVVERNRRRREKKGEPAELLLMEPRGYTTVTMGDGTVVETPSNPERNFDEDVWFEAGENLEFEDWDAFDEE